MADGGPREVANDGACPRCGFQAWLPVHAPSLSVTRVGLYDDGRFPGRCIVAHVDHVEHLDSLTDDQVAAFWIDVVRVGAAVRRLTKATRVNYAVLGNATPHLHAHVIPRYPEAEELPTRPPWNDPRTLTPLGPQEIARLTRQLENVLR